MFVLTRVPKNHFMGGTSRPTLQNVRRGPLAVLEPPPQKPRLSSRGTDGSCPHRLHMPERKHHLSAKEMALSNLDIIFVSFLLVSCFSTWTPICWFFLPICLWFALCLSFQPLLDISSSGRFLRKSPCLCFPFLGLSVTTLRSIFFKNNFFQ